MRIAPLIFIAGAALAQDAHYQSVATTKQLMAGLARPSMNSLGEFMKSGGPKDEKEWAQAQQSAAVLGETAQLLQMGSRPKDQDVWLKATAKLLESASASAKAAEAKDAASWKASVGNMGAACKSCHSVYHKTH